MHGRRTGRGYLAAAALALCGCGSGGEATLVRVTFVVSGAAFSGLDAAIAGPMDARLVTTDGPACDDAVGRWAVRSEQSGEGLVTVELTPTDADDDGGDGIPGDSAIVGTRDAFGCRFLTRGVPLVGEFTAEVSAAYDSIGAAVIPAPVLAAAAVDVLRPHSTTTTLPVGTPSYDVTFRVSNGSGVLAALQFDVRYIGQRAAWRGAGGAVACTTLADAELATYNARSGTWMSAAMIDLDGFSVEEPVARCTMQAVEEPRPENFSLTVIDASTPTAESPDPYPFMEVASIVARSDPASPTSTVPEGGALYGVTFGAASTTEPLAALQFDVRYRATDGDWVGSAGEVDCTTLVDVALSVYNSRGRGWFGAAMIDLVGFSVPSEVSRCVLRALDAPSEEDFLITVIDASTRQGQPADPHPTMEMTSIVELGSLGRYPQAEQINAVSMPIAALSTVSASAVRADDCHALDPCVCASKGSEPVSATDALMCLKVATSELDVSILDCRCS